MSSFIQLMVTELQEQDPLNPMDNTQLLTQLSQIESIQSSQQLSQTLGGEALGQSVATGSSLLNQSIQGTDANGNAVSGVVSSVSVANGSVTLQVGTSSVPLANVSQITPGTSNSALTNALANLLGQNQTQNQSQGQ